MEELLMTTADVAEVQLGAPRGAALDSVADYGTGEGPLDPSPVKAHLPRSTRAQERGPRLGIMVADDQPFYREGIRAWVEKQPQLRYCGEVENRDNLRESVRSQKPDLLVFNPGLERQDPDAAVRRLRREFPDVRLLVLIETDQISSGESVLRAGAHGLITRDQGPHDLLQALHTVQRGDIYLNKSLTALMLKKAYFGERADDITGKLSSRELQIFGLLGQGYGTREIASRLGLSRRTVNVHRENIKHKLGVKAAANLVYNAITWVQNRGTPFARKPDQPALSAA
jgi:DNA-binding NarL/FixJ family response regulator